MNDRGPVNIQGVSCDTVHDIESVMFMRADVSGKPADPATWTDEHWASLDAMCREFGAAVIGATRDDLTVNADILPQTTKRAEGTAFVNCRAYPSEKTDAFAAGQVVAGAGKSKIRFTPT